MTDFSRYFLMIREDDPAATARDVIAYTLLKTKKRFPGMKLP